MAAAFRIIDELAIPLRWWRVRSEKAGPAGPADQARVAGKDGARNLIPPLAVGLSPQIVWCGEFEWVSPFCGCS